MRAEALTSRTTLISAVFLQGIVILPYGDHLHYAITWERAGDFNCNVARPLFSPLYWFGLEWVVFQFKNDFSARMFLWEIHGFSTWKKNAWRLVCLFRKKHQPVFFFPSYSCSLRCLRCPIWSSSSSSWCFIVTCWDEREALTLRVKWETTKSGILLVRLPLAALTGFWYLRNLWILIIQDFIP